MAKPRSYRIGQACKRLDIQPYVLRYWETEFPSLAPDKSKSGQRVYTEEDLEVIRRIKELLYDEGFTIAGAKKRLEAELSAGGPQTRPEAPAAAEEPPPAAPAEPAPDDTPAELDTAATERIETLLQGIREARGQVREILAMLDGEPANQRSEEE